MTSKEKGAGGNRFARAWSEWDAGLEEGKQPQEMISELPSEKIMQLLAGAGNERRYERDILATEAMNRLVKARQRIENSTSEVAELIHDVEEQADKTRRDVHATEAVVKRLQGSDDDTVKSPQELTAHSASDLVETLMSTVEKANAAMQRLQDVRRGDLERALGTRDDDGDPQKGRG